MENISLPVPFASRPTERGGPGYLPGTHFITTIHPYDDKGGMVSERVSCESGEILYVEIAEEPWSWGKNPIINIVDNEVGRKAIMKRNLILLPSTE
jgi:hypothetical protein